MRDILASLHAVSETDVPVLFVGESGTGKRLLARHVHEKSPRRKGPFVTVDCGALPRDLLHSELFGHERGAFAWAYAQRRGHIELAQGGTLFLDTLTELPLTLQANLASYLEDGTMRRLGGNERIAPNCRVLAASEEDPALLMRDSTLKRELHLRFLLMKVPPLRERKDDIPPLIDLFLREYTEKYRKPVNGLAPEAHQLLVRHDYPGNVRELEAMVEKAFVLARGNSLSLDDFPILGARREQRADKGMREVVQTTEKSMVLEALVGAAWVQTKAADALGISERMLRYKMKKLGITREVV